MKTQTGKPVTIICLRMCLRNVRRLLQMNSLLVEEWKTRKNKWICTDRLLEFRISIFHSFCSECYTSINENTSPQITQRCCYTEPKYYRRVSRDVVNKEPRKETKGTKEVNNETVGNSCLFYLLLSPFFIMNIFRFSVSLLLIHFIFTQKQSSNNNINSKL